MISFTVGKFNMLLHLGFVGYLLLCFPMTLHAEILEHRTDKIERGAEFAESKGGPEHNKLEVVNSMVRAGSHSFKHEVTSKGERSEIAMMKTEIGGEYWYGWSMLLPESFDCSGSKTIVMQLATWPTKRNGKFPCNANGSFMHVDQNGQLVFHLQRQGDESDMVCDKHVVFGDVRPVRGQWLDFVMHAKWTGDADGFLQFWVKSGGEGWQQKIDWKGRTFWNDEDRGPYFKMGLYTGEPGWKGPPERTLYTDEYRLGDAKSSFNEVAPGIERGHALSTWLDEGFEELPIGFLEAEGTRAGWEVQQTGRDSIKPQLRIEVIGDKSRPKSGNKCLALSIPKETIGFEFVTVGQRVHLLPGKEYEASVWVRWPDGPEVVSKNSDATSGHPSAIVSFWARHQDGTGHFAGRDEWLFDNRWHRLTFRFRATDPEQRSLIYVSLLPNQKPVATTILVDDFELRELDEPTSAETRNGSIALDSDFNEQPAGAVLPPWYFSNIGGTGIDGEVIADGDDRHFRITMDRNATNFESAQLWQHVSLQEGASYEISVHMRWDNFTPNAPSPIVNYGIYHEPTRTWYGPVDQVLEKTNQSQVYRFTHVPPHEGPWKLYVQLNGWGNFGHGVTVSFDQFQCIPRLP